MFEVQIKHMIVICFLGLIIVSGFYIFLKSNSEDQQIYNNLLSVLKQSESYSKMSMKEILSQEVDENVLSALYMRLSDKCEYGMEFNQCNEVEKNFYLLYDFNAEVGNGGIEQFIYNSYENVTVTLAVLKESSLNYSYSYLSNALNLYPNEKVEAYENKVLSDALGKLDDQYYDLHEKEYYDYIIRYVNEHKDSFTD